MFSLNTKNVEHTDEILASNWAGKIAQHTVNIDDEHTWNEPQTGILVMRTAIVNGWLSYTFDLTYQNRRMSFEMSESEFYHLPVSQVEKTYLLLGGGD